MTVSETRRAAETELIQQWFKLGMVVYAYYLWTWVAEAGGLLQVWVQFGIHSDILSGEKIEWGLELAQQLKQFTALSEGLSSDTNVHIRCLTTACNSNS